MLSYAVGVGLLAYLEWEPEVGEGVRLEEHAFVIGRVRLRGPARLGERAVIRGDGTYIEIGPGFVLGAGSSIHVDSGHPTIVGADVWVGADVVLHGCVLGDGVRVEEGGIVLTGGTVGRGSIVAADALVSEGVGFPENSYIAGTPGRRQRDTTAEEREETRRLVQQGQSGGGDAPK